MFVDIDISYNIIKKLTWSEMIENTVVTVNTWWGQCDSGMFF